MSSDKTITDFNLAMIQAFIVAKYPLHPWMVEVIQALNPSRSGEDNE